MEFVKKNLVLVIFLAIGLSISGVLVWLALSEHSSMQEAKAAVDEKKKKIEQLNQARPRPMKENVENINKDVVVYTAKLNELHSIFGKVFNRALAAFVKELDPDTTVAKMKSELEDHWRKVMAKEASPSPINAPRTVLRSFLQEKKYEPAKIQQAKKAFAVLAANETTEPLEGTPNAIEDCILDAFGYPRVMTDIRCQNYLVGMQQRLLAFLDHRATEKNDKGEEVETVSPVSYSDRVKYLTFDSYASRPPPGANIPYIMRHCRIIENLCLHIKEAKITRLEDLKRENLFGTTPVQSNEYVKYTYTMTVIGNMPSIRTLVNKLAEAYRDNRVYVIKKVELTKLIDGATAIGDKDTKPASFAGRTRTPPPRTRVPVGPRGVAPGAETAEIEKPKEYWEEPGYPNILIGKDKDCKAVITFDYYLYIGDEIKLKP